MQPHRGPKSAGKAILSAIRQQLKLNDYRKKHWEGSFDEYFDIVREHLEVMRRAYQHLYDMIMAHGTERRVVLLHGPVGRSKSTIARLLKRGLEDYSKSDEGMLFRFAGELNIANRGLVEFIEVLKLDVAFLYDLLGASQEHKIKPKKFADTDIDEVILGHGMPKNALFRVP